MFYINEFLDHLSANRFSPKTMRDYAYLLNHFIRYLKKQNVAGIHQVSDNRIMDYIRLLEEKGANKTFYIKIKRLIKYFNFLEEKGYIFISPLRDYRIRSPSRLSVPTISDKKIHKILPYIRSDTPLLLKGKAILELAYSSALRPREIYNLKSTDIDFNKGILFIEQSKNKKDRIVPIGKEALFWVDKYITEVRTRYIKDDNNHYVFISHKTGKKLTVWGIRWVIQETLRMSGFDSIKPYSLRKASATDLFLNGMSVAYIRELLGHVEMRTTQVYLNLNIREMRKVISIHHPRNMFKTKKGETQK